MCIALAPAMAAGLQLAVTAASTAIGFFGQQQAANAQEAANAIATQNAVDAANETYAATQTRMQQEAAAASTEKMNANLDAVSARATALTAAGESGVQGNSVSQLLASFYSKQGRYSDAIDQNLQMSRDYLASSMDQTSRQTQSVINSLPTPQRPSFLDAAIRVAAGGLSAATDYTKMKAAA